MRALWSFAFCCFLNGCANMDSSDHWSGRILNASKTAIQSPNTWVPLTGAVLMVASNSDHEASDWAVENKPLIDHWHDAEEASNTFAGIVSVSAILSSALLSTKRSQHSRWDRLKVDAATFFITSGVTEQAKTIFGRDRPKNTANDSFPSGHTSQAFCAAAITAKNLKLYRMSKTKKMAINISMYTLAYGTAWARVESQNHYPSDVLAGAALGNFIGIFLREILLKEESLSISAQLTDKGGAEFKFSFAF